MLSYKYRAINKYSLETLENNTVYFSRYTDFNDPFELSTPFPNLAKMYTRASKELDLLHEKNIFSTTEYARLKNVCENIIKNGNPALDNTHKHIRERLSMVGIYSLSKVEDEILMWSHYADNHKGFCIGFDNLHKNTNPQTKPFLVNYRTNFTDLDDPAIIIKFYTDIFHTFKHLPEKAWQAKRDRLAKTLKHEDDQRGGISILTDKYEKWAYEQEIRLVDECNFGLKSFNPKCVKSITFGLRTSQQDIENVINTCQENKKEHVVFFQAEKCEDKFELKINKLTL